MTNTYTIYTKWLAYELRKQGFRIVRTDINPNFPQFYCWEFEDNEDLQIAIRYLTQQRKNNKM